MEPNHREIVVLERIKPFSDHLMQNPCHDTIEKYMSNVLSLTDENIQGMHGFFLFPFFKLFRPETSVKYPEKVLHQLLTALVKLLKKVKLSKHGLFMKYCTTVIGLIFGPGNQFLDSSEEIKLLVVECVLHLILNLSDDDERCMLYQHANAPVVGQAIFVCVHIAKNENNRALRLMGLNCMMALTYTHSHYFVKGSENTYRNPKVAGYSSDMLSFILPGVAASVYDLISKPENIGYKVKILAVQTIRRVICLVMRDTFSQHLIRVDNSDFKKLFDDHRVKDEKMMANEPRKQLTEVIKKSAEWYDRAGAKLRVVCKGLSRLEMDEHRTVRLEYGKFCSRILLECPANMSHSIRIVIDSLIVLSEDKDSEVSDQAIKSLETYFHKTPENAKRTVMDSLLDSFYQTLTKLPRVLNGIDAAEKLTTLNYLRGYLALMANDEKPQRLVQVLTCPQYMTRLANTLIEAAKLDTGHVKLLPDNNLRDVEEVTMNSAPWCQFKHLDLDCLDKLKGICAVLGATESVDVVADHFFDLLREDAGNTREIIFLLNEIGAAKPESTVEKTHVMKMLVDTYIEPELWYLPTEVGVPEAPLTAHETRDPAVYNPRAWHVDNVPGLYEGTVEQRFTDVSYAHVEPRQVCLDPDLCATIAEAQGNVVQCCLVTDGVGRVAQILAGQFQPYLLKTLCMVLERVASHNELIRIAGLKTLSALTYASGLQSMAELIRQNSDYFTHHIITKLRRSWDTDSATQVLSVVLRYSDADILPCLYDIINNLLLQTCDRYQQKNITSYLKLFHTFIKCLVKWFEQKAQQRAETKAEGIFKNLVSYIENTDIVDRNLNADGDKGRSETAAAVIEETEYMDEDSDVSDENEDDANKDVVREEMKAEDLIIKEKCDAKETFVLSSRDTERIELEDIKEDINIQDTISTEFHSAKLTEEEVEEKPKKKNKNKKKKNVNLDAKSEAGGKPSADSDTIKTETITERKKKEANTKVEKGKKECVKHKPTCSKSDNAKKREVEDANRECTKQEPTSFKSENPTKKEEQPKQRKGKKECIKHKTTSSNNDESNKEKDTTQPELKKKECETNIPNTSKNDDVKNKKYRKKAPKHKKESTSKPCGESEEKEKKVDEAKTCIKLEPTTSKTEKFKEDDVEDANKESKTTEDNVKTFRIKEESTTDEPNSSTSRETIHRLIIIKTDRAELQSKPSSTSQTTSESATNKSDEAGKKAKRKCRKKTKKDREKKEDSQVEDVTNMLRPPLEGAADDVAPVESSGGNEASDDLLLDDLRLSTSESEPGMEDKGIPSLPTYIEVTVTVMKRSIHFLPSKNQEQRLLALDILNDAIGIMKDHTDDLLPVVHLIWSPLVLRFRDFTQPVIINRAFRLLMTMGRHAKDFIRSRTIREVFPALCEFLNKSSTDSYLKERGSYYRQTQQYKLQLSLLGGLGELAANLDFQERQVYELLAAADSYLSNRQPKTLQEEAVKLFKTLLNHDHSATWLHLMCLWNNGDPMSPPKGDFSYLLRTIRIPLVAVNSNPSEYRLNVTKLLGGSARSATPTD